MQCCYLLQEVILNELDDQKRKKATKWRSDVMYTTKRIMSKDCPHVTAKWSQDTSSKIWEYIAAMIKIEMVKCWGKEY